MASIPPSEKTVTVLSPTEVYTGTLPLNSNSGSKESSSSPSSSSPPLIKLRIATGGAGQSGLLRALANAYLDRLSSSPPLTKDKGTTTSTAPAPGKATAAIAWYASDTTQSFNYLAQRAVDLSFTYHPVAERIALRQGVADRREACWRDHWVLVGPKHNPANLEPGPRPSAHELFSQLFIAAVATQSSKDPVRFLSRYDSSAANIKESSLWAELGQTPWAPPVAQWYHCCVDFPFRALETAAKLGEYTLTDKGTWNSVDGWVREAMTAFIVGGDEEDDPLLNPASALVGKDVDNKEFANEFLDWVVGSEGQEIFKTFSANGVVLYSPAPPR